MQLDLRQQVAIVTGAGRGIGRAISLALGQAGAQVVLVARSLDQLEAVAAEIRASGGTATPLSCDLSNQDEIAGLFSQVHARFGRLDVQINNAGIGLFGPLAECSSAEFDRMAAVNLRGTFLCCQKALRLMIPERRGYIINIASVVGIKGYANQSAYAATKHGVMGLTKVLAVEAQPHGIRTSVVLPGGVDTEMAAAVRPDLDRSILLQPADVADTVCFLLSLSERAAIDEIYIRRRNSQPW